MKSSGLAALTALALALSFGEAASAAERSRDVSSSNSGTGALSGQLTATFNGNQVVYGTAETVTLTPLFTTGSGAGAITTRTDTQGRFLFQDLPPGQYELRTQLSWTTTYVEVSDDGTSSRMYTDHSTQLATRVQVKPHQTARVTTFSAGATRDAFYAYGGLLSKPHHPLVTCR